MKCDRAIRILVSKSIKNQSTYDSKDEQCLCDCQTVKRISESDSDKQPVDKRLKVSYLKLV